MRALKVSCCAVLVCLCAFSKQVDITVLATTDLHGNIYPYDYLTGRPAERGLAKIATLIARERVKDPNLILIDCGDTIQGTPLESVYQQWVRTGKFPLNLKPAARLKGDPMMLVMNYLRYDAMTVGNHEFNFGLHNLAKARADALFPWISANATTQPGSARKPFAPYALKTVKGVKVAIIGITTPAVPSWEKPENVKEYRFADAKASVLEALADARKHKPDVVIVAAHAGVERDLRTGDIRRGELQKENMVHQIATEVPGIDAIVFGHTHQQLENFLLGDVLLTQPKNWGFSLAKVNLKVERKPGGGYRVVSKSSTLLPVTKATGPDPTVLRIAKPYHDLTEAYLNSRVAQADADMSASESRVKDTAMIDAIQKVQMHYAKADVSFSAAFNPRAAIPKGPVTIRQVAALYIYDNELYAIEGSGRMVREALENSARFYNTCPDAQCSKGPLINRAIIGYNFEAAQGVTYDIDLTKPAGQRIRNLKFRGRPLDDAQPLRIALNNYRYGGSGGYTMFRGAKLVWRSFEDIRELIIRYYSEHPLSSQPDNNWRVVPEPAHKLLEAESAEAARFVGTQ
jgi:2',3'-cyclic-nucleotide 2'-phosphodiesterase / 3'-nucleotidase